MVAIPEMRIRHLHMVWKAAWRHEGTRLAAGTAVVLIACFLAVPGVHRLACGEEFARQAAMEEVPPTSSPNEAAASGAGRPSQPADADPGWLVALKFFLLCIFVLLVVAVCVVMPLVMTFVRAFEQYREDRERKARGEPTKIDPKRVTQAIVVVGMWLFYWFFLRRH